LPDVIIIGAGISGLTAAYKLAKAGKEVIVLEEASRAGGKIVTNREKGYLLESGPNSLRVENQETIDLIEGAELTERIIDANPTSKKRYVLKEGRWVQLPRGPKEAINTPLFSLRGKLQILWEPLIGKTKLDDESAASFVRRRLGKEILDYGADPFITGIYAGDPDKLSMKHAFASMWRAEQDDGSLLSGLMKRRKGRSKNKVKPRVISFPEGLSELTTSLRSMLGNQLHLHTGAIGIERSGKHYAVTSSAGSVESPSIIFALPAYHVAPMIEPVAYQLSRTLMEVTYPPVAVVFLGYAENQFVNAPEGFGGLIPSKENRNILGIIFSSSNFPNRAPTGHLLLTVLIGGARNQEIVNWTEDRILERAISEVRDLLKPNGEPEFKRMTLWNHAIPQYNVGYSAILEAIELAERENPRLHFIGNYRGGISMGACIKNATELANRLV
jgi:protoporphyrinogen/coproporphyrinogen III oxidase